jgi:hypothetical protein
VDRHSPIYRIIVGNQNTAREIEKRCHIFSLSTIYQACRDVRPAINSDGHAASWDERQMLA